jgi:endonuclease YncB( thermonuclease family)
MKSLILTLFFFASCASKVTKVFDGDTILINHSVIRLAGIDCPELAQPYGIQAKNKTAELCLNKQVKIEKIGKDKYRRTIAFVKVGKISVNNELLRLGYAWRYSYFDNCLERSKLEFEAQINRRGLWADCCPIQPWIYRLKK